MPGKSQAYTDPVLNVLRGKPITGVTAYAGLYSAAAADENSAGTEFACDGLSARRHGRRQPSEIANTNNIQFGPAAFGRFNAATNGSRH